MHVGARWTAAMAFALSGCFFGGNSFEHDPGPGPSDAITTSVIPRGTLSENSIPTNSVSCEGPAEQLEQLGSLCSISDVTTRWNGHVGDLSLYFQGDDGPALLLLGFYGEERAEAGADHAEDIRYAAYLVFDPPPPDPESLWETERRIMRSWERGEALRGALQTEQASQTGCSTSFAGTGTLEWRDTTITLEWGAVLPC
ncbi:MAG TPA: hypothetical protein VIL20_00985 [Sandaracinaceae bacterium]